MKLLFSLILMQLMAFGQEIEYSASADPSDTVYLPHFGQNEILTEILEITRQNTPNPFNQSSEIKFTLKEDIMSAVLYVYDMQGRQIRSYDITDRGSSSLYIDAGDFEAGMYMYSLIADGQEIGTKKLILTK